MAKNDFQYGGWNSYTLQCDTWRHVILHQSAKFYPNRITLGRKKNDVMSIFKMEDQTHLGFYGPIMGSFKSPCATSYRSSIETIALALDCSAITARRRCIARTMPRQAVCPPVCLSHAGSVSIRSYISGSPNILFFHTKRDRNTTTETPLMGASNARGYKKSRFSTNITLYPGIDAR